MRLHQEFAASEITMIRWMQRGMIVLSLGALSLSAWWVKGSQAVEQAAIAHEKAAARTEGLTKAFAARMQEEGLTFTPDQVATVREEVMFANQLTEKRAFSWTRLLSDLEDAVPPHVSLGSIKVDFQESTVHMEGVADRLQDLNRFVQTLQVHRGFHHAILAKHEVHRETSVRTVARNDSVTEDADGRATHHIEFSLAAQYRPTF